jgi:hypothetical protein
MNQLNFTINLNKHGELKQQEEAEKKTFINFTIFFIAGVMILYGLFLFFHYSLGAKLEARQVRLSELTSEMSKYRSSGEYLSARDLERLATISTDRVFWARKLVALSEDMSDKIAITHFGFKHGVLSLYGIIKVDTEEKEFDLIIRDFIRVLKANPDINEDFPEIRFVRANRDREKDAAIIRFQVDCMGSAPTNRRGGSR